MTEMAWSNIMPSTCPTEARVKECGSGEKLIELAETGTGACHDVGAVMSPYA